MPESCQISFTSARDICYKVDGALATLAHMAEGREAVGERIRKAAEPKGIAAPKALLDLFLAELKARNLKQTITRQTMSNWWHGRVYPDLDLLSVLADILETEQEWLLFGSKRSDQLKKDRVFLTRVSEEEALLLTTYREASRPGQKTILKTTRAIAEDNPAEMASVHKLRRKDDRIKE